MNRILFASALAAALAATPILALAGPNEGAARPGRAGAERGGRGHGRHARHGLRVLKSLDLTDAQKALLADGRAAAEPVRADLRAKIRALFEAPKSPTTPTEGQGGLDERKARREKIRALMEAARAQVEPSAQKFVAALTVEQKTKLSELAQKHGKAFDEGKFSKRIAGLMLAPGRHGHYGRHGRR
jgi:Spy/CpxP family protein refolding chaperone